MSDMHGKAAIVTGGTRGIGRAIAARLLGAGLDVVVAARTDAHVEEVPGRLMEEAGAGAGRALGVRADVSRRADCERLVAEAVDRLGRLDVLVNNAGIGRFAPVVDMDPADWDAVQGTNVDALFYMCHAALPHLQLAGGSWIINIGSLAGKNAFPGGAAYNASKFALIGFSEALMQEVRHDGVRVSYIMPGSVATEFSHPHPGEDDWKIQPQDVAALVMDLLAMPARTLPSRIEVRPSAPPRK
jgi:NAD(P)-dependent dehydrogenase (short-subunit alcohol dehydrogenase family)